MLTNAAPTPTRPQSAVLSMYNSSGVYTNHPVERWLASWSGAGESTFLIRRDKPHGVEVFQPAIRRRGVL